MAGRVSKKRLELLNLFPKEFLENVFPLETPEKIVVDDWMLLERIAEVSARNGTPTETLKGLSRKDLDTLKLHMGIIAERLYPDKYMNEICKKIGFKNSEQKELFVERVRYGATRYMDLTKINSNRLKPHKQIKLLNQYQASLIEARKLYIEIQKDTPTSGKLNAAVRKRASETEESGMKEMFHPYANESSVAITLFENFLSELIKAVDDAKRDKSEKDKADFTSDFLVGWVIVIGKYWARNATITFALGKYDKELSMYTSPCIPIIHDMLCKVETDITVENVETMLRKIIKKRLVKQPVANFFLV